MKQKTFLVLCITIWLAALTSLLAIRYLRTNEPTPNSSLRDTRSLYQNLDEISKRSIDIYESAIIGLHDGTYKLIGSAFEPESSELVNERRLARKEIVITIEDPLVFERRLMAEEAFRSLDNAAKRCYVEGYGALVYQNGLFYFYFDEKKYGELLEKSKKDLESREKRNKPRSSGRRID